MDKFFIPYNGATHFEDVTKADDSLSTYAMAGRGGRFVSRSKSTFAGMGSVEPRLRRIIKNTIDMCDVEDYVDLTPYVDKVLLQLMPAFPNLDEELGYLFTMECVVTQSGLPRTGPAFDFTVTFLKPTRLNVRTPVTSIISVAFATL